MFLISPVQFIVNDRHCEADFLLHLWTTSHLCVPRLTCVDAAVFCQVTGDGEGLPTVLTDVRFLSSVNPHVFL